MPAISDPLIAYDRSLGQLVCGADETGRACWAGPLVAAAVRFDHDRLRAGSDAVARLEWLNDSKQVTPRRRRALLPAIFEAADQVAIVVIPAAQIDREGIDAANLQALRRALEAVAIPESVNLVDCFDLRDGAVSAQPVEHGDGTSAAIAAASVVANETRDQLMRGIDVEYPGYGFAANKGYGTPAHEAAIRKLGHLSPAHRLSIRPKVYNEIGVTPPA